MDQPVDDVGPVSHAVFGLARAHKELAGRLLRSTGLYPGQELVLMELWRDGPQRQVDVVRRLGSDAATMTRSVQRLERAGLVSRTRNDADARSVIISATPASEPLRAAVEQAWQELERTTVAGLTQADRTAARRILERLRDNLEGPARGADQRTEGRTGRSGGPGASSGT